MHSRAGFLHTSLRTDSQRRIIYKPSWRPRAWRSLMCVLARATLISTFTLVMLFTLGFVAAPVSIAQTSNSNSSDTAQVPALIRFGGTVQERERSVRHEGGRCRHSGRKAGVIVRDRRPVDRHRGSTRPRRIRYYVGNEQNSRFQLNCRNGIPGCRLRIRDQRWHCVGELPHQIHRPLQYRELRTIPVGSRLHWLGHHFPGGSP
jgi:hypothetical protein